MVQITLLDMTKKTGKAFLHYRGVILYVWSYIMLAVMIKSKGMRPMPNEASMRQINKRFLKLRGLARIWRMARPPWAA